MKPSNRLRRQLGSAAFGLLFALGAKAADAPAAEMLVPPKRLVGVQGVSLGMPVAKSHELLQERGWSFDARRSFWNKGNMTLNLGTDRRDRIDRISFVQTFANPAEGQFDVAQVRQQLLERYGTPELDQRFKRSAALGDDLWITWREGTPTPGQPSYAPYLKAMIGRERLNMNFAWGALAKQVMDDDTRQRQSTADGAPKKKISLD